MESERAPLTLQPLLHDSIVVLRAPTQVWSGSDGDIGGRPIQGVYHGDTRFVRRLVLECRESAVEAVSFSQREASRALIGGLLRGLDDRTADPKVRIERDRQVRPGGVAEAITLRSHVAQEVRATLILRVEPEFAAMDMIKLGAPQPREWSSAAEPHGVIVRSEKRSMTLRTDGAVGARDSGLTVEWSVTVPAGGEASVSWELDLHDPEMVVQGAAADTGWSRLRIHGGDPRLGRWVQASLADLDALRLALPDHPEDEFLAAGAPWFFTLFGRDSLWAARLLLPIDRRIAASTLRVLARLQGTAHDPSSAQQPGKILHELRSTALEIPGEGVTLPPVYYGTVDATALWVCLLADAWRWGVPDDEVRALLPALRGALDWLLAFEDRFIDYVDETGHGLANQGWKDSGDSIQWRTGELAEGPIALCEVQGYAYEAAVSGAEVLDALGEPGGAGLRSWAGALKARFAEQFWVDTPEGRYPAIALDARGRPVDSLTSNIGHLLGTGILEPGEEAAVAALLTAPSMLSGFGIRTMSTGAMGYWPLSYHGGSVWMHDTAIIATGMARAGLRREADLVIDGMLAAAVGFGYRVPELHSGDPAEQTVSPVPYPAACRPQAWSAAAAVATLGATLGRRPDRAHARALSDPHGAATGMTVDGIEEWG